MNAPTTPQTPRGAMPPDLLSWPHQVPTAAVQCLADADMAQTLELGPPQWWQGWQRQRLQGLIDWLARDPDWHRWLSPLAGGTGSPADWERLPVMRREDYRAHNARAPRVPASHGPLERYSTSGSTGVPVVFHASALATRINAHLYWGDHQRQRRDLRLPLATLSVKAGAHAGPHRAIAPDAWLHPGPQVARDPSTSDVAGHARWLCEQAPRYLVTYPRLLAGMLDCIESEGLAAPRVDQVLTFTETVDEALRAQARRVLGARIADRYSCEELGPLAFQCPESDAHYHVAVSNVIVEVVDDKGRGLPSGVAGDVLVTGLHQWASPAIRYDLGDVAALQGRCPGCGATVPVLSQLLGRRRTLVRAPSGSLRYVRVTSRDWLACAPILEHRLSQIGPLDFRVELVTARALTDDERRALRQMLSTQVGPEFRFDLRELARIDWPPGRKRQDVLGLDAFDPDTPHGTHTDTRSGDAP